MTFQARFEVSDEICGVVEHFARQVPARVFARQHTDNHKRAGEHIPVVVFDRCASKSKRWRGDDLYEVWP